jgi:hypothetical protein
MITSRYLNIGRTNNQKNHDEIHGSAVSGQLCPKSTIAVWQQWRSREMKNFVKLAVVAGVLVAPVQAFAVTGDVLFNGDVSNTCAITVGSAGVMMPNVGQTQLSSENAGGSAGAASIVATSAAYQVSINAPTGFNTGSPVAPSAFAAKYSATGASVYANQTGANPLATGTTNVSVHLAATKTTGSYATGTYSATVVLRCE